jgi:hypothetical protein
MAGLGQLQQPELRVASEWARLSVSDLISARTLSSADTQATAQCYGHEATGLQMAGHLNYLKYSSIQSETQYKYNLAP